MKKLLLLAAVTTIVACSKNETFNEPNEVPIGFTKVYVENSTKAIATGAYTTANFEKVGNTFGVFGYKQTSTQTDAQIFTNQKVEYKSGLSSAAGYDATGNDWTYSPIKYWDKQATAYNFYAYAPHDGDFTGTAALASQSENAFTISGFQQAHTQSAMIDLLADLTSKKSVTGTSIGTNDVAFVFKHILSNINIEMALSSTLKADETDNPVTIVSVKIGNIKMDGGYAYASSAYAWTLAQSSTTAEFSATPSTNAFFEAKALKSSEVEFTPAPGLTDLLFVPQAVDAGYKITLQYNIGSERFDKEILLSEFKKNNASLATWAPGNKYTYRIIIGPNPILFDISEVSDWADGGTYTYTVE